MGGQGGNCPLTFAQISLKLLQNKGFSFKILFFAPPLLVLPPYSQASSNTLVHYGMCSEAEYRTILKFDSKNLSTIYIDLIFFKNPFQLFSPS